jgi:hypothetical protein
MRFTKLKQTGYPLSSLKLNSSKAGIQFKVGPPIPTKRTDINFMSLPRELRDVIYGLILNYDGVQDAIDKLNDQFPDVKTALQSHANVPQLLQTPGILLANWQIYEETRQVLCKRILTITCPLLASDFEEALGLPLNSVIAYDTLQRVPHVRFELDIWSAETCATFHESGHPDHTLGNWDGGLLGESFLLHSDAWAIFIISCLEVWLDTNNLKTFEFLIHDAQSGDFHKRLPIRKVRSSFCSATSYC